MLDHDRNSLDTVEGDLARRFGSDFDVRGDSSEAGASDFLTRAHELHPRAKRVLLVDRDYSVDEPGSAGGGPGARGR